jgi:hypothetical protein
MSGIAVMKILLAIATTIVVRPRRTEKYMLEVFSYSTTLQVEPRFADVLHTVSEMPNSKGKEDRLCHRIPRNHLLQFLPFFTA